MPHPWEENQYWKRWKFQGFFVALIGHKGVSMIQRGLATRVLRSEKSYALHTRSTISLGRMVTNLTLDTCKQLCELFPMHFLLLPDELLLVLGKLLFPSTLITLPNNIYLLFLTRKEATKALKHYSFHISIHHHNIK